MAESVSFVFMPESVSFCPLMAESVSFVFKPESVSFCCSKQLCPVQSSQDALASLYIILSVNFFHTLIGCGDAPMSVSSLLISKNLRVGLWLKLRE